MNQSDTAEWIYSELGGDPDLGDLVEMFVEEMPQRIDAFQQTWTDKNPEELGRLAHQMKGAAGSYGFSQLTSHAAKLERAVKDHQPEEEVLKSLQELIRMCSQVRAGIPSP